MKSSKNKKVKGLKRMSQMGHGSQQTDVQLKKWYAEKM